MKRVKYIKRRFVALTLSVALLVGTMPAIISAQDSNVSNTLLQEGTYSKGKVTLTSIPNTTRKIMAFITDIGERSELNCSELVYTMGTDERWSVPVSVEDDGTLDMEPFVYSGNDKGIIVWTNATKEFTESSTSEDIAKSMRVSLAVFDSTSNVEFKNTNVSYYDSENISTYTPKVTEIDGKFLVSWIVYYDTEDKKAYGIEGFYYNPDANIFYSENNSKDENGRLIPMVFAKDCNYISSYAIAKVGNDIVTVWDEPTEQINISDVMNEKVVKKDYYFGKYKSSTLKMSIGNGNNVKKLTDGSTYASVIDSDIPGIAYYNKGKIYKISNDEPNGLISTELANVSKTGDTKYSIVSKDGVPTYITALLYEPLKTNRTNITIAGEDYEKTVDGIWKDKNGNVKEFKQEDICIYYINPRTGNTDTLPQKLYDRDEIHFPIYPAFIIDSSNQLGAMYIVGQVFENTNYRLIYSTYNQKYLFQADYSKVDEAIAKANVLNKDDYIDFNAVTLAIDAVVRDKDYTEQSAVDAMAKAIEDAIKALQLKPTPETTTTIPETTTTEQVTTNQETTTVEQVPTTSKTEATTVEQVPTTSRTEATTEETITMVNPTETETQYIKTSVNNNTPKTGENSNITLWMIVFFITAGGILTIALEKRKEDKQ
ncbi:hypothetical protein [uncultured Eubacterium sp.]|uniref:hypothetical protein n=1 Tax=uncultured Eubacterium sp. TaxID=165185 RepID=UPI002594F9DC|nr:hypothetical protein [uncultured Eubacterium sp.]